MSKAKRGTKVVKPAYEKYHDHGTAIRRERGEITVENNLARVKKKTPLDDYIDRKFITEQQFMAGLQLQIDYAISHENRSILNTMAELRGCGLIVSENALTARDRYNKAIKSLNRTGYQIAYQVLIQENYLNEIHAVMGWALRNTGMDRLREVLDDLDDFYCELRASERERRERELELCE